MSDCITLCLKNFISSSGRNSSWKIMKPRSGGKENAVERPVQGELVLRLWDLTQKIFRWRERHAQWRTNAAGMTCNLDRNGRKCIQRSSARHVSALSLVKMRLRLIAFIGNFIRVFHQRTEASNLLRLCIRGASMMHEVPYKTLNQRALYDQTIVLKPSLCPSRKGSDFIHFSIYMYYRWSSLLDGELT